jgi:hypothetical protein
LAPTPLQRAANLAKTFACLGREIAGLQKRKQLKPRELPPVFPMKT